MKKMITVISFVLSLAGGVYAQKDLNFDFDYARFNYDSSSVYVEFYFELNPRDMRITPTTAGQLCEAVVHLEMKNAATNEIALSKDWKIQSVTPLEEIDSVINRVSDVMGFVIPAGKYSLLINARDVKDPGMSKTISETVILEPFKSGSYAISDIEIARNLKIDSTDKKSVFYKNSMEIYPNPTMVYTQLSPVMFFYAELYHLISTDLNGEFSLIRNLYNSSGVSVQKSSKNIKQSDQALVDYGVINLSKLPTDSYSFELALFDPVSNKGYTSSKRFYLYNPKVAGAEKTSNVSAKVLGSEYALLSLDECNKMFSYAKYLASKNELEQYSKIDSLSAKREFLFNFWNVRDDNPATEKNELKEEYMNRVALANKNYTRINREGYLTDRGRILVLYGEPDQKDYFNSDSELKPYEVWFYNQVEGGVTFIFGDISGFGNFELLHSTKRGEVYDDNWKRRLQSFN